MKKTYQKQKWIKWTSDSSIKIISSDKNSINSLPIKISDPSIT